MKNAPRIATLFCLLFSFALLVGCGAEADGPGPFADINMGMTDKQVTDLVGEPNEIENAPGGGLVYVFGDNTSVTMSPDNKVVSVTHKGVVLIGPMPGE